MMTTGKHSHLFPENDSFSISNKTSAATRPWFTLLLGLLLIAGQVNAQIQEVLPDTAGSQPYYHGVVVNKATGKGMPYANIFVLRTGKGTISNEKGAFSLNTEGLKDSDTIRFQYVGFRTLNLPLSEILDDSVVYLEEEIINLAETIIFGNMPDLKTIVKNVLVYKDSNYRNITSRQQVFVRDRDLVDVDRIDIKYLKSTIDEIDRNLIRELEDKFPKNQTSYTDLLANVYRSKNKDDTIKLKIDPVRTVALKEKEFEMFEQLNDIFRSLLENTGTDEYWKVRSGIFGQKLDLDVDSIPEEPDTANDGRSRVDRYTGTVNYPNHIVSLDDKDMWEFLHKTARYDYTLAGGARINGEEVYIIDFKPRSGGTYEGRMFIAMENYALIRADFRYGAGKTGTDFHLLGLGYTENIFEGSVYFEKRYDTYLLKYLSIRQGAQASVDRNLILKKKQERWLFDNTMKELKLGFDLAVTIQESTEYLVLEQEPISEEEFSRFDPPEYMDIIYVDQFDDNLWRGYNIIEPTQRMKEYKKQDLKY